MILAADLGDWGKLSEIRQIDSIDVLISLCHLEQAEVYPCR
jgi:hypothetical protein